MPPVVKVYKADGSTRSLWHRQFARVNRGHGVMPVRASHVRVVEDGPHRGYFYVDLTPLAALTGDHTFNTVLPGFFESHEEAVAAEQDFLLRHWVLG
jgi:hypothetical protein